MKHDGLGQYLLQAQCHRQHPVAVESSRDGLWAQARRVLRDYRPWEHNLVGRLEDWTLERELSVVQGTVVCR